MKNKKTLNIIILVINIHLFRVYLLQKFSAEKINLFSRATLTTVHTGLKNRDKRENLHGHQVVFVPVPVKWVFQVSAKLTDRNS